MRSCVLVLALAACGGGISGDAGGDGGSGTPKDSGPTQGEDPSVAGIVAAHNVARAAVSPAPASPMPALSWSTAAATKASGWAAGCHFGHNPDLSGFGENIYASSGSSTAQAVVTDWVSEKANYNYSANSCSGTCGHYTQVVWAATTGVGCAKQTCTTGSPFGGGSWELWVCDYVPPGNFNGQRPY